MSSYVPVKLAYDVTEPEKRTNLNDLIFIHGYGHSKIGWDESLTKKFADHTGRRAYSLDMRNHGDSEWTEDFSIDIMVKDVLNFMDEKGIKQAVLIGQSMGAKVSMDLALAQPDRVEKIVSEDFGPDTPLGSLSEMVRAHVALMMKAIEAVPPDASYKEAKKLIFNFIFENNPEEEREKFNIMTYDSDAFELPLIKKDGRYVLKSNMEVLQKWLNRKDSLRPSEGLCTKPALFIYGTLSPLKIYKEEELIMKLFPNAKLHAIEGATHTVHNDLPDEFYEVVLKFLSES